MNGKHIFIIFITVFLLIGGGLLGYQFLASKVTTAEPTETSNFANPFATKPATSFGKTTTPTPSFQNPFGATPTPAQYQNPFDESSTASYQNPFEKLK